MSSVVVMEKTTPSKTQMASSIPPSQFENSPIFDYINNLSPIDLVKSVHTDQAFNLPSFSSPLPVFASPPIVSLRDATSFTLRSQCADQSKPEPPQGKDDNNTSEGISKAAKLSDPSADQFGCFTSRSSVKEDTEPLSEHLDSAIDLPNASKFDSGISDGNILPLDAIRVDAQPEREGNSNERHCLYESKKDLRKIFCVQQNENEAGCDWMTVVSDGGHVADILTSDSSIIEEPSEDQKMAASFISNVLQIPQDNTNNMDNTESIGSFSASKQNEMGEIQATEFGEQKDINRIPSKLSGMLLSKLVVNDAATKVCVKGKKCSQSTCKPNRVRRRCLVFEMAGTHKKKSVCDSNSDSSISSQTDCAVGRIEKLSSPQKTGMGNTLSMLSGQGIGLHLNALATSSRNGNVLKIEMVASRNQEINLVPCDNIGKIMESSSHTSMIACDDSGITSPKMKRHKLEHVEASCKRCNCKRSKCLKLYCECFAAGLYCIEPCSCQDCFNKPAHEDTVLETRKMIESRNPLAFAPKVIRSTESGSEFGDESNKTPASARHKRGCNCKKSSCLKKYCECFQVGVGCSSNCRCEGCKNSFGSKNDLIGVKGNEVEGEETDSLEKNASEGSLHDPILKMGEEEHPYLPRPPETARSPIHQLTIFSRQLSGSYRLAVGPSAQICANQKLQMDSFPDRPKLEKHLPMIPEDETPEILTTSCSTTTVVKSSSPNSKRVSPPHQGFGSSTTWRSRKLILRSVPPFPSLNSPSEQ